LVAYTLSSEFVLQLCCVALLNIASARWQTNRDCLFNNNNTINNDDDNKKLKCDDDDDDDDDEGN